MKIRFLAVIGLTLLAAVSQAYAQARPAGMITNGPTKAKLLEWGGDSPSVQDFRDHIDRIEATPFDGTVISVTGKDGDKVVDLGWRFWCKESYKPEHFTEPVKILKAAKRKQFTDCFLRVNVTPGDISFLDDKGWSSILENAKAAAWVAKESKLKGWMFDVEQYEKQVFKYPDQNKMQPGSFEEYQKAARRRGSDFIKTINSEYPDITILMTFGYSLAIGDHKNLEPALYGLLPAFLDGVLEAAHKDTTLIDGLEFAYGFKTRTEFETLKALMRINGKGLSKVPELYQKRMKMAYGIWIDNNSGTRGWDPEHPEKNYFQPKEIEESLRLGLELTETYVWLYSERLNWYTRKAVTEPYLSAVANAQTPPKKVPASIPGN